MIGWNISVYRQADGGRNPAVFESSQERPIAVWQAGLYGLRWIDQLVQEGKAINLGGNGYPYKYTAKAVHIVEVIREGPPEANAVWTVGAGDLLMPGYLGKTAIDQEALDGCLPEEWLLIEVWDES